MIQTILITALSAQLSYLKPTISTKPQTPQYNLTQVLPKENSVKPVVKKTQTDPKNIILPGLQNEIMYNDKLQQPMVASSDAPNVSNTFIDIPLPTATATPTPQPTIVVVPSVTQTPAPIVINAASPISDDAITYLGNCEAGMNPARNSGNGYYGAFQFSYGTWKSMNTGYERADLAPIEVQEAAVKQLLQRSSIYNQFPGCSRKMHAAGLI